MSSKEECSTVSVNVLMPPLKPIKMEVIPPTPQTINLLFRIHPDLVFLTNYDLNTKLGSIFNENFDMQKEVDSKTGELTIQVQHLPYTEQLALEHAQNFARICFSHSAHRQITDCTQSVVGWISRNYEIDTYPSLSLEVNDLEGIFPEKYQNSSLPYIINYLDISNSPLTPKELLQGCLLKLTVTTIEKETFTVYASKEGWFSEKKNVFPTLHLLICSLSKFYSDNYFLISEKWCKLRSAERQPYYSTHENNSRIFVERITNDKEQITEYSKLRLFNKKVDTSSLSNMTLDDLIDEARASGENESFINQLEQQYVTKSLDAVSAIERGSLVPFCGSSSYLYQDLFISRIEVLAEANKDRGGFDTANRTINNEIQVYSQILGLKQPSPADSESPMPSFRFVRPIRVDFFTNRFIGQTCIPGLVAHRSPIVYGYVPGEDAKQKEFNNDPEVVQIIKDDMMKLGIGASSIHGCKEPIFTSSETTAVSSTDGFLYISDYKRITPRDANYPDPQKHHGCVIRQEAVTSFANYSALEKHSKELIDLGGDKENLYHYNSKSSDDDNQEKAQKLEQRRRQIIEEASRPLFDINALTSDSEKDSSLNSKSFPQNVKDIAKFVVDCLIPKFIREYVEQSSFIVDGKTIVHEMHSRGINARYLGRILNLIQNDKSTSDSIIKKYFCLSLEAEIISRSFKYIKRSENASIESLLNDLNTLVGLTKNSESTFSELFDRVTKVASEKFGTKQLNKPNSSQRFLIIRSILSSFGVSLYAWKDIESHPIGVEDVCEITPLVKFPFTRNVRFTAAVEIATSIFSRDGATSQALSMFNVALQIANADSIDPFDAGISLCYFYMSLIYDQQGDYGNAYNACLTSTIIQERHSDQLSPEIIIRYSLLARYSKLIDRKKLAFAFADRAANLGRIIAPLHPWIGVEYTVAVDLAAEYSPELAINYAELKLKYFSTLIENGGDKDVVNKQMSKIYLTMSKALLKVKKISEALENVQKALELDPENAEVKDSFELIKSQLK